MSGEEQIAQASQDGPNDQPSAAAADVPADAAASAAAAEQSMSDEQLAQALSLEEAVAQSIVCTDCGKTMANAALAQYHAEKSGHTKFEESTEAIKPLSEEEKKAKLEELRARLAVKRAAQSKEDTETQRANEKIRRKAGQEMGEVREEMKRKEMAREAEKKRQEARADVEAKRRVREQIEADKRERAERIAREKAARQGGAGVAGAGASAPDAATTAPGMSLAAATAAASSSTSNEARLRVRCPDGQWMGTLSADSTLRELENRLQADGKADAGRTLNFTTTFPRKQLTDKLKTLRELGLVPNAALEASY